MPRMKIPNHVDGAFNSAIKTAAALHFVASRIVGPNSRGRIVACILLK